MLRVWPCLVLLCSCASQPTTPTNAPPDAADVRSATPDEEDARDEPAASSDCIPLVEADVVAETYAKGAAQLEGARDGEHMKEAPLRAAMDTLKIAAENGSVPAQSLYGRTLFGTLFTAGAPEESQREDYVSAVAFLRLAAKAGDEAAANFMPGLLDGPPLQMPLDSLPEGWVEDAFERADAWIACHGLPQGKP